MDGSRGHALPFDGTPFTILGFQERQCMHGPDHHKKKVYTGNFCWETDLAAHKENELPSLYSSKGCSEISGVLRLKEMIPLGGENDYQNSSVRGCLRKGSLVKNLEIYITLPDPGDHRNHLTGEISGLKPTFR